MPVSDLLTREELELLLVTTYKWDRVRRVAKLRDMREAIEKLLVEEDR